MAGETLLNDRYELVAQQGSGGMSVIYKAQDRLLGRMVAIKILRPSLTQESTFLEKFRQEARSVAAMSHPNIVTVHDVGSDGPTHYIVMEMIEGQDLKRIIRMRGALPLDSALDYGIQICAGLGFAHRSHLVHADVKPQNILVNRDGVVKVTDFGIAQAYTDTMPQTRSEVVWGSPHYFAPEQARGEKPSPASDVYSIGVVLFEAFTGSLPFTGASQRELALAHIQADIPQVSDVNPEVPREISNIIAKVMSKRRNDRYKHADQLGQVLQGARERARNPRPAPLNAGAAKTQPPQRQTRPAADPGLPASSGTPRPPKPLFNRDGSLNVEATGGYTGPFLPQRQERRRGPDAVTPHPGAAGDPGAGGIAAFVSVWGAACPGLSRHLRPRRNSCASRSRRQVYQGGAPRRRSQRRRAALQLRRQRTHFFFLQDLPALDRARGRHSPDQVLQLPAALAQPLQNQRQAVAGRQLSDGLWQRAQDQGIRPKGFHHKTERVKMRAEPSQAVDVRRRKHDRLALRQLLADDAASLQLVADLLIQNAFMRRVLIDQVQAGRPFCHDIGRAHLPHDAQDRQGARLARRLGRGRDLRQIDVLIRPSPGPGAEARGRPQRVDAVMTEAGR